MNLQEATALNRQLQAEWPQVGEVRTYDDSHAVFEFMRYCFPAPSETHLMYVQLSHFPADVLDQSGWKDSTAGWLPCYLFSLHGSDYMVITPMHDKPLTCIRFGCPHTNRTSNKVGRYAYDFTCQDCGHKWTIDSGD